MPTNSELITQLQQAKKDTATGRPQRSAATYAVLLTNAQTFINEALEVCRKELSITLVASQREYTVDSSFVVFPTERLQMRGGLVYWDTGSLDSTDPGILDARKKGWRDAAAGTPEKFYLEQKYSGSSSILKLGLVPKPSAAFVVDPTALTMYAVVAPADIAAGSSLPFDNNAMFRCLHQLLVDHALWALEIEDGNLSKADERWKAFVQKLEVEQQKLRGVLKPYGGFEFYTGWRRGSA